ncbi:MAG: hypothetical protein IPI20_07280 [Rhodoferax sp.]|nr:hypothetical protein [Rhodoferax sp.]
MNIDTTSSSTTEQEADPALQAITVEAKGENAKQIAALSVGADQAHVTEHILGMVATTMAHVSTHASTTTRANAEHWQQWALGVAKGV